METEPSAPVSMVGRKRRLVYIMDDEPEVCTLVARVLNKVGFVTREFTRVAALEMALAVMKPEIIVLDLSLGRSDAIEVMRSLAAARFVGAVLLMSGTHELGIIEQVQKIGEQHGLTMLRFLRKPFRSEELQARLAEIAFTEPPAPATTDIEEALRNNWLELWYQPKIDLRSQLIYGAEALVRLRHPERGVLLPADFLPPSGDPMHTPLANFVIRRALADWQHISGGRIKIRLAVNMPVSVFETNEFVNNMRRYLPTNAMFSGMIVELTEDEVINNPEFAREIATQLKLYNIDIAIDDFGTCYSTIERLKQLPFAELKIDRQYVHGCANDRGKYELCQNIVAMAHRLGISVVAEGVQSPDDVRALVKMQCDGAQGFLFAHAMEREHFAKALMSRAVEPWKEPAFKTNVAAVR